jgi:predicted secreted protein
MYGGYMQQPYGMYGTSYPYSGYYGAYGSSSAISGFTSITSTVDADVELDSSDDGDEITVDEGDTISITLSAYHNYGYYYVLDDDDLDEDVVDFDTAYYCTTNSIEQWVFDAEGPGTTTIVLEYTNTSGGTASTFEVEITVE